VKEFWKSINIWENYGQEFSVLIVFWLTVYKTAAMCELKTQQNADRIGKNEKMKTTGWAKKTPGQLTAKHEESAWNNRVLACNFAKYSSPI